jgi:hypothetical protein
VKTEIPLLAVAIAAAIYACSVWLVFVYITRSFAMSAREGQWLLEELEMLF